MNLISANRICRRSAFLPLGVVIAAALWSGTAAQAGLIAIWKQQPALLADDLGCDASGIAWTVDEPVAHHEAHPGQIPSPRLIETLGSLAQPIGAAPPPSSAGNAHGVSSLAMVLDMPSSEAPRGTFCYLGESVSKLPQPPLGELLDPPRTCA